ncbi:MAG: sulfite exporter TauE/SafE family protein [Actinomycetota bacterium]
MDINELVVVFIAGFLASLVDGALGMGFGPTSSSILLGGGLSPAAVSTTVNLAKVATGLSGAIAHWRFENIDHRLVGRLALPGCAGALIGVTVLASVDGDTLKPVLSCLLLVMAARILLRFSLPLPARAPRQPGRGADGGGDEGGTDQDGAAEEAALRHYDDRGTAAVAAVGGVTNGLVGAWGPVVTPFLLHRGLTPRFAIGSVNTAEVAVAVVASGSLLASIGGGGVDFGIVLAMLAGGVLAAPLAAWVVRFLPARALGVAVGGLLLFTNLRQLASTAGIGPARWGAYALVVGVCVLAALRPRLRARSPLAT